MGKEEPLELYCDTSLFKRTGMIRYRNPLRYMYSGIVFSVQLLGLVTTFVQVIVKAREGTDLMVLVEALHWFCVVFTMMTWSLSFYLGAKDVSYLVRTLHEGFFTYQYSTDEEQKQYNLKANASIKKISRFIAVLIYPACFGSMLRDPLFGDYIHEEGSEVTRQIFYNTWYPFAINTWTRYALVCTFEGLIGLLILYQTMLSFDLINCWSTHLATQLKILQMKINKAHIYAKDESKNEQEFIDNTYKHLVECVLHHRAIIRYYEILENVLRLGFGVGYFSFALMICAGGYMLTGPDSNIRSATAFLAVLSSEVFMFGFMCSFGEMIVTEGNKIYEAVYSTPWFEEPKKIQVLYRMMMFRASKPLALTALRIKPICLVTFGEILQSSYSYFNMLNIARG